MESELASLRESAETESEDMGVLHAQLAETRVSPARLLVWGLMV
jgi:hypothetical protein